MPIYTLTELNTLSQQAFIACLSDIYEHSSWVAECVSSQHPFPDVASLANAMQACVQSADRPAQLKLIRAHPELAGKLAIKGDLTSASLSEQATAGLNDCTPKEFTRLVELNRTYQAKFDFPFIVAVRGMRRADIIAAMEKRVMNTLEQEISTALNEIGRIANFRLNDRLTD